MSNYIKLSLYFLVVFVSVSTLTINYFSFNISYFVALVALMYYVFNPPFKIVLSRCYVKIYILILLFLVYGSGLIVFGANVPTLIFEHSFKIMINFLLIGTFISLLSTKIASNKNINTLRLNMIAVHVSCLLLALVVMVCYFDHNLRFTLESLFPAQGNILDDLHFAYNYRVRGILPSTGSYASVFFALGFYALIFDYNQKNNARLRLYYLFSAFILIFAMILNARSGMFLISVLFMLILLEKKTKTGFNFGNQLPRVKRKILVYLIILVGAVVLSSYFFPQAFARFSRELSLVFSLQFDGTTFSALYDMVIFPDNFLFGDPLTYSTNRIHSDIGYIRILNAIGFVGFVIYYSIWLYVSFISCNLSKGFSYNNMIKYFFILLFIMECKEPFFSFTYIQVLIFMVFSSVVITYRKQYK